MRSRQARFIALPGLLAVLLLISVAQPASAHAPAASRVVYNGGYLCVLGGSEIAYNHTTKELSTTVRTEMRVTGAYSCDTIDVRPPGWLAVRSDLQKWTGSAWAICTYTNWSYNTTYAYQLRATTQYGTAQPCGPGYYQTLAYSFVWDGSAWRSGTLVSGYHPVPA